MKPTQQAKFEALLEEAKCPECKGRGGWNARTDDVECPTCKGTGLKPGYEIGLINTKAELPKYWFDRGTNGYTEQHYIPSGLQEALVEAGYVKKVK